MPAFERDPSEDDRPSLLTGLQVRLRDEWRDWRRDSWRRSFGRNKNEIYLTPFLLLLALAIQGLAAENGLAFILAAGTLFLLASVCTINALRDWQRMHWLEQIGAIFWCPIVFLCTIAFLVSALSYSRAI